MMTMMMKKLKLGLAVALAIFAGQLVPQAQRSVSMREVNEVAKPAANQTIAIVGATLIDGRGASPVNDAVVIVRGEKIVAVGARAAVTIPKAAALLEANGLTLLPGLIDAHFHLDGDEGLPSLFLSHGVTSVRDPGAWMEAYDGARQSGRPLPRLFLAGPHLDNAPPAYPHDAFIVRDAEETRLAVNRFVEQGASVIKVYFRLPLGLIRVSVETAHARGVPVTAHLEIVDAADAIRAGVDGIEHITSFGTALLPPREAEKYRQAMLADNNARREGRYKVWSGLDLDAPRARPLLTLIAQPSFLQHWPCLKNGRAIRMRLRRMCALSARCSNLSEWSNARAGVSSSDHIRACRTLNVVGHISANWNCWSPAACRRWKLLWRERRRTRVSSASPTGWAVSKQANSPILF
jgi:hypothetical protein